MELTESQINDIIQGFVREILSEDEDMRVTGIPLNDQVYGDIIEGYDELHEAFKKDLSYIEYGMISKVVDSILEKKNITLDKSSYSYRKLCRDLLKASMGAVKQVKSRHLGDYSDEVTPIIPMPTNVPPEPTSEKLSVIVESYWKENSSRWKPRSQTQYKGIETWLLKTLGGDTPIHTVDYQKGREVKELLLSKKHQGKPLSKSRVILYINHISAIWNWAKKNYQDQVTINPFKGLQPTEGKRADEERDAFSGEDLESLFVKSPEFGQDMHN
jgi:hypothetical protein